MLGAGADFSGQLIFVVAQGHGRNRATGRRMVHHGRISDIAQLAQRTSGVAQTGLGKTAFFITKAGTTAG